jgi:hypothetical protein
MRGMDEMLDRARERKVSLIGVSFGGLIAACYAAQRPERVSALVLASAPAPVWNPKPGDDFCVRYPRIGFPYFAARSLPRLGPEMYRARDSWSQRVQFAKEYARRAITAPFSPLHAAQWIREWQAFDITEDCGRITAPTLVVTGEPKLDKVWRSTDDAIHPADCGRHACGAAGNGHLGVITNPIDAKSSANSSTRPGRRNAVQLSRGTRPPCFDLTGPAGRSSVARRGSALPRVAAVFGHPHPVRRNHAHEGRLPGRYGTRLNWLRSRFNFRGAGCGWGTLITAKAKWLTQGGFDFMAA